eukprot:CAMPEP_0171456534 /NCGR_PEP_ID=MMETSP0945-20130129/2977_1 /TAXON_ID=109269 /ORGANISM="Vaucheria litorea, Strain CCMP2940" /LENGTH=969 /DNA_ID=CAMNT_0011981967 /DNA_START=25 /DNA_END=2935 /DNA_ORIENTATION=+
MSKGSSSALADAIADFSNGGNSSGDREWETDSYSPWGEDGRNDVPLDSPQTTFYPSNHEHYTKPQSTRVSNFKEVSTPLEDEELVVANSSKFYCYSIHHNVRVTVKNTNLRKNIKLEPDTERANDLRLNSPKISNPRLACLTHSGDLLIWDVIYDEIHQTLTLYPYFRTRRGIFDKVFLGNEGLLVLSSKEKAVIVNLKQVVQFSEEDPPELAEVRFHNCFNFTSLEELGTILTPHNDNINHITAWGETIITASKDGKIRIFNASFALQPSTFTQTSPFALQTPNWPEFLESHNEYAPYRMEHSVQQILPLKQTNRGDGPILIACTRETNEGDRTFLEISLLKYDLCSDMRMSPQPTKVQEVRISSGKSRGNIQKFFKVSASPKTCHLFISDTTDGLLHVLRFCPGEDRFDLLRPYQLTHPALSIGAWNSREGCCEIFIAQYKYVQILQVRLGIGNRLKYSPDLITGLEKDKEVAEKTNDKEGKGATKIQQLVEEPFSFLSKKQKPYGVNLPPGVFLKHEPSLSMNSLFSTEHNLKKDELSSQDYVHPFYKSFQQEDQSLRGISHGNSPRLRNENSGRMFSTIPMSSKQNMTAPPAETKWLVSGNINTEEHKDPSKVKNASERQNKLTDSTGKQILDEKDFDAAIAMLIKAAKIEISSTLTPKAARLMTETFTHAVIPCLKDISAKIESDIAEAHRDSSLKAMDTIRMSIANAGVSAGSQLTKPLSSELRESVRSILLPALEESTRRAFNQMNTTLKEGMTNVPFVKAEMDNRSVSEIENKISSLAVNVERITSRLEEISVKVDRIADIISRPQTPGSRSNSSNNSNSSSLSSQQVKLEVFQLVKKNRFEEALTMAIASRNTGLLVSLCKELDFNTISSSLSQPILLSLLQQLGSDLTTDVHFKLIWLQNCAVNLDTRDSYIRLNSPEILTTLRNSLEKMIPMMPSLGGPSSNVLRTLLIVIDGHRNSF